MSGMVAVVADNHKSGKSGGKCVPEKGENGGGGVVINCNANNNSNNNSKCVKKPKPSAITMSKCATTNVNVLLTATTNLNNNSSGNNSNTNQVVKKVLMGNSFAKQAPPPPLVNLVNGGAAEIVALNKNGNSKSDNIKECHEKQKLGLQTAKTTGKNTSLAAAAAATKVQNASTNAALESEESRKKRCSDRYDSSESSDSGVATLSCTDSSTTSSDTSDPGSPYSPASIDDINHHQTSTPMAPLSTTVVGSSKSSDPLIQSSIVSSSSKLEFKGANNSSCSNNSVISSSSCNGGKANSKLVLQEWPWNSNLLPKLTALSTSTRSSGKLNGMKLGGGGGSVQTGSTLASSLSSAGGGGGGNTKKASSNNTNPSSASISLTSISSSSSGATAATTTQSSSINSAVLQSIKTPPMLVEEQIVTPPQTKITGFFKSQMKPAPTTQTSVMQTGNVNANGTVTNPAYGKKDITNLVIRSRNFPDKNPKDGKASKAEKQKTAKKSTAGTKAAKPNNPIAKKPVTIAPRIVPQQQQPPAIAALTTLKPKVATQHMSQPTMVLAAIRIGPTAPAPSTQNQGSQPQNPTQTAVEQQKLVANSANKINAMFPYPIASNFVQIPNLINSVSSTTSAGNSTSGKTTATTNTANILMSNCQLGQLGNGLSPQYFLNAGALLKLASAQQQNTAPSNGLDQGQSRVPNHKSPPALVPTATATMPFVKSFIQQQPQQQQPSGQASAPQHAMFMTTPQGILLNAGSIPGILTANISAPLDQGNRQQQARFNHVYQQQQVLPAQSAVQNKQNIYQYPMQASTSPPSLIFSNQIAPKLGPISVSNSSNSVTITTTSTNCKDVGPIKGKPQRPVPPISLIRANEVKNEARPTITKQMPSLVAVSGQNIDKLITPVTIKTDPPALSPSRTELFDKNSSKSPTIPMISPEEPKKSQKAPAVDLKSPKSMVLERMKSNSSISTEVSSLSFTEEIKIEVSDQSSEGKLFDLLTEKEEITITKIVEECAKSPILSQPKTIRFPNLMKDGYRAGLKGMRKSDGRVVGLCYWDHCDAKYDNSFKLLDHLQTQHVNPQTGPFSCLWSGCRVHGRESCSRRWLESHVLSHGGTKTFKCIFDGCGQRFGSQHALQKHVNIHLNSTENAAQSANKKTADSVNSKVARRTGKKLRYRRQPWSARMFDFFDTGIMEGLRHRLVISGAMSSGPNGSLTFKGRELMRRVTAKGSTEVFVKWFPCDIIPDEWVNITEGEISADIVSISPLSKHLSIQSMAAAEKIAFQRYLRDSYKRTLDKNGIVLSLEQQQQLSQSPSIATNSLKRKSCDDLQEGSCTLNNSPKKEKRDPKSRPKLEREENVDQGEEDEEEDADSGNGTVKSKTSETISTSSGVKSMSSSSEAGAGKLKKKLNKKFPLLMLKKRKNNINNNRRRKSQRKSLKNNN